MYEQSIHLLALNKMPFWVDPKNCQRMISKEVDSPCFDCAACDQRQRYHWIFSKYQPKLHLWEFAVLFQKICYAGIALFLTTREGSALTCLIVLNILMIAALSYYQPYLTDEEYLRVVRLGNTRANIKRSKKCSKEGCGINNSLDIVLLLAETSLCISALITHNLIEPLEEKINSNLYSQNTDTINVTNGTITVKTLLFQNVSNYDVAEMVAEAYPVGDAFAALFEWIGLLVFLSGYSYFAAISFIELRDSSKEKYCSKQRRNIGKLKVRSKQIKPESDTLDKLKMEKI